jgi:hypothetical protein
MPPMAHRKKETFQSSDWLPMPSFSSPARVTPYEGIFTVA